MDCPGRFGQYELIRRIAVGGMAEIYLAKVGGLAGFEKHLVLKVIHPKFAADPEFIEMLVHEAKLAVRLTHANIAQVFDLGVQDERYFIALEYVDGLDVFQFLRRLRENRRQMPFEVAAFVTAEVGAALDYAHNRRDESGRLLGIIHRDISPQNVLLSYEGDVKVIDFGIAKVRASSQSTAAGIIKGKFFYMSPEQAKGQDLDQRSDVFAVGALFYELLTLRMLYDTESINDALRLAKRGAFLPPSTHRPDLPEALDRIVLKALTREREQRYQSADEMRRDLVGWLRKAAPGFGRHRLESHLRDICGINTQVRLARMRRDEFRAQRQQSMIVRDDPTEEQEGFREPDEETREITPSVQRRKDVASRPEQPTPRDTQAAEALARRIREARANLRWTDEHDVPAGLDAGVDEEADTYDVYSRATTLTQVRADQVADGAPTRPRREVRRGGSWPPAGPEDDTTERDPARSKPTRPVGQAPSTPAPRPEAPTRPVGSEWVPPSVLEAESSPFGEQTDVDETVVDPGPLARALEEAEAAMLAHELDPTPVDLRREGSTTTPYRRERQRQRDRVAAAPQVKASRPRPAPKPKAPASAPAPGPSERPKASAAAKARRARPAAATTPPPPPREAAESGPSPPPLPPPTPRRLSDSEDDFADATWPEPISGAPPSRPRSVSRGVLVGVGAAVLAIGVALGFLIGPGAVEPVPDGSLFITSRPRLGATIYLDGQQTQLTTPAVIHQLPGNSRHHVRGTLSGFREAAAAEVTVAPGTQTEVVLALEPIYYTATLESVPAGAEVVVDGQVLGRTPTTLRGLTLEDDGTLTVLLRLPRHLDSVFTLRWPEGETHVTRSQTLTPVQ